MYHCRKIKIQSTVEKKKISNNNYIKKSKIRRWYEHRIVVKEQKNWYLDNKWNRKKKYIYKNILRFFVSLNQTQ